MAHKSTVTTQPSHESNTLIQSPIIVPKPYIAFALLFLDAFLVFLIISYVPYTKIDWDAYMFQVTGFLEGERDYSNLKGDTGPLVYPAGFLYVYSIIQYVTGGEVYPAQILFGILYIVNLAIIMFIYVKTDVQYYGSRPQSCNHRKLKPNRTSSFGTSFSVQVSTQVPWWALSLLCLSKRVHSIFVLRLFNDCFAMTIFHAALALFICQRWHLGLIIFSVAVSIKMNVLLYAPPLLLLLLKGMTIGRVITSLAGAALVQIILGFPFLVSYPVAYISRAFNLGRVFIHFWSVNFKFVPEPLFVSKQFALSLLVVHLVLLAVFAHKHWCKHEGGLLFFLHSKIAAIKLKSAVTSSVALDQFLYQDFPYRILSKEHIVTTMFVGNFIGIVCSRSLHYQFYSWYFFSLPFLLWKTPFPTLLRLILFLGVEVCWNIYPSNLYSSFLLFSIHLVILWGLWIAPCEDAHLDSKSLTQDKKD